jgi:DNA (cytosine-5)-methyltransferase 1
MKHENEVKYLSTFSGIGGFELGIERALGPQSADKESRSTKPQIQQRRKWAALEKKRGFVHSHLWRQRPVRCVGYSEIDRFATKIYQHHFPDHKNYGDITRIGGGSLPDFDLFVGGFPCQAFSLAGKRRGFDDTRGTLFFDVARVLAAKTPRNFVLENVRGLLSHDHGRTFKTIIATLVELGYRVEWQVLNSKDFGVPQSRERVYVVGHFGGGCAPQVFPLEGAPKADRESTEAPENGPEILDPAAKPPQRGDKRVEPPPLAGAQIRRLTPIECERLQGFPDGWTKGVSDTQRYKCLGNAVTVNVVEAIITALYR